MKKPTRVKKAEPVEPVNEWDIEGKKSVRRVVTKNHTTDEVAKEAGFLPAENCLCIKEAMKNGTIDLGTKLFLFDDKQSVLDKAKAECNRLGFFKVETFKGDALDSIDFLLDANNFKPDFVFLDLCGQYSQRISEVLNRLAKLCPVALTIMPYYRHPKLVEEFVKATAQRTPAARRLLNNEDRERKYGFEGEKPTEGVVDTSAEIVSSIMTTLPRGKRVKLASTYRGKKRQMLTVAVGAG
tara:strand:- start:485 stop:1204 length:720 start_codon:yes stop_codon:yes gene_type:complete